MRIFGSDRMGGMLQRLGLQEGEAIIHPWINKALEKAQKKVEARNFDTRKNLLKYDDVMNDQRKEVYAQRREFMSSDSVSAVVAEMREDVIANLVARRIPERAFAEQWESAALAADVKRVLNLDLPVADWAAEEGIDETGIRERLNEAAEAASAARAERVGPDLINFVEKSVLLQTLDQVWKEHLLALDHLRQGIGLRAYGQRDPLNEYKREAFALFHGMLDELKERVTHLLAHVTIGGGPDQAGVQPPPAPTMFENHPEPRQLVGADAGAAPARPALPGPPALVQPYRPEEIDPARPETWGTTPRNAACPCGSGKKYKYCHGRV
jgi:preprotein translocase subunit SecA